MTTQVSDEAHHLGEIARRLSQLVSRLKKFSLFEVTRATAGLLTAPENHPASARLEALIHLAAMTCRGDRVPQLSQLREWINDIIFRDHITRLEDPVEDVFVSNLSTWIGNVRLFEGHWIDNDYHTQMCLAALTKLRNRHWTLQAQYNVTALLRLSEAVADRAAISRYALSDSFNGLPLRIAATTVDPGRSRITFSRHDVMEMGISTNALLPFAFTPGDADALANETLGHTTLERKPLLCSERWIILALPTAIGAAVRRFLIKSASKADDLDFLQAAIDGTQIQEIFHFGCIGWRLDDVSEPHPAGIDGAMEFVGRFDDNGYAQIVFIPDNIREAVEDELQGVHVLSNNLERWIQERITELASRSDCRRGLTIVVHGGVGRGIAAGLGIAPDEWQVVGMSAADFMRFAWDTEFDGLRAWKLLTQERALISRGIGIFNINGFPNLYAYAVARDFELVPPDFTNGIIRLATNFLTTLRRQLRAKLDQHVALGPDRSSWIEVQREATKVFFAEAASLPAYFSPKHISTGELLGCTETGDRTWWVQCQVPPDIKNQRGMVFQIWEMCRNWLIPLAPKLEERFPALPSGCITIRLGFPEIVTFDDTIIHDTGPPRPPDVHLQDHHIVIECPRSYLLAFSSPTNIGERLMVSAIVYGTAMVSGVTAIPFDVYALVDEVVRSEDARFVHFVPTTSVEETIFAALPPPRPQFQAREDRAWSRLGLAREAGWTQPQGAIPVPEAHEFLHRAVDTTWARIHKRLESLSRSSVIERALLNHEAVQYDRSLWRMTAAAVLALYRDTSDVLRTAHDREVQRALAGRLIPLTQGDL